MCSPCTSQLSTVVHFNPVCRDGSCVWEPSKTIKVPEGAYFTVSAAKLKLQPLLMCMRQQVFCLNANERHADSAAARLEHPPWVLTSWSAC